MRMGELGVTYRHGDTVFSEGDKGDDMYVIQSGTVEVVHRTDAGEVRLAELGPGEIFGEMAMFGNNIRSATIRSLGDARIMRIDRKIFMQKIHQDPSLAFRIMEKMSERIRKLNDDLAARVKDS